MLQRKKETENIREHKVGNNDNIANFVMSVKTQMS